MNIIEVSRLLCDVANFQMYRIVLCLLRISLELSDYLRARALIQGVGLKPALSTSHRMSRWQS